MNLIYPVVLAEIDAQLTHDLRSLISVEDIQALTEKGGEVRRRLLQSQVAMNRVTAIQAEVSLLRSNMDSVSRFSASSVALDQAEYALRGAVPAIMSDQQRIIDEFRDKRDAARGVSKGSSIRIKEVTQIPSTWESGKAIVISVRGVNVRVTPPSRCQPGDLISFDPETQVVHLLGPIN